VNAFLATAFRTCTQECAHGTYECVRHIRAVYFR
jgi:hypothetical protein